MMVPRSVVAVVITALIVLSVCVVISTLAINQYRKDRVFMFQHCTFSH